jgi:hypothetical protein
MVKKIYGVLSVLIFMLMFWTQGLCERGALSIGGFLFSFALQLAAWVWSLYQCGAFGRKE